MRRLFVIEENIQKIWQKIWTLPTCGVYYVINFCVHEKERSIVQLFRTGARPHIYIDRASDAGAMKRVCSRSCQNAIGPSVYKKMYF